MVLTLRKFPRTPQPWESLGSEVEVEEENVTESRPKVSCSTCTAENHSSSCLARYCTIFFKPAITHFFVSLHALKGTALAGSHAQLSLVET